MHPFAWQDESASLRRSTNGREDRKTVNVTAGQFVHGTDSQEVMQRASSQSRIFATLPEVVTARMELPTGHPLWQKTIRGQTEKHICIDAKGHF